MVYKLGCPPLGKCFKFSNKHTQHKRQKPGDIATKQSRYQVDHSKKASDSSESSENSKSSQMSIIESNIVIQGLQGQLFGDMTQSGPGSLTHDMQEEMGELLKKTQRLEQVPLQKSESPYIRKLGAGSPLGRGPLHFHKVNGAFKWTLSRSTIVTGYTVCTSRQAGNITAVESNEVNKTDGSLDPSDITFDKLFNECDIQIHIKESESKSSQRDLHDGLNTACPNGLILSLQSDESPQSTSLNSQSQSDSRLARHEDSDDEVKLDNQGHRSHHGDTVDRSRVSVQSSVNGMKIESSMSATRPSPYKECKNKIDRIANILAQLDKAPVLNELLGVDLNRFYTKISAFLGELEPDLDHIDVLIDGFNDSNEERIQNIKLDLENVLTDIEAIEQTLNDIQGKEVLRQKKDQWVGAIKAFNQSQSNRCNHLNKQIQKKENEIKAQEVELNNILKESQSNDDDGLNDGEFTNLYAEIIKKERQLLESYNSELLALKIKLNKEKQKKVDLTNVFIETITPIRTWLLDQQPMGMRDRCNRLLAKLTGRESEADLDEIESDQQRLNQAIRDLKDDCSAKMKALTRDTDQLAQELETLGYGYWNTIWN